MVQLRTVDTLALFQLDLADVVDTKGPFDSEEAKWVIVLRILARELSGVYLAR